MKFFLTFVLILSIGVLSAGSLRHRRRSAAQQIAPTSPAVVTPVTVGTKGNEPIIARAPDGTLYISALQYLYHSIDNGATWVATPRPPEAAQLNLASDSSISIDPGNRLYFTFDYPYAGNTAVCTSDDKGDTWFCNPAVVPGGTDRMWIVAPTNSTAYEVTNEGLYETAFLSSTDRGVTWTPKAVGSGVLEPQSGPLLQGRCSNKVLQPVKIYGTSPSDIPELKIYVYDPTGSGSILSDARGTGLPLPLALPSGSLSPDGVLYTSSEEANIVGGKQVVVARSNDEGVTWTKLPPIPATTSGTAAFTWVAAGAPGHIGVLYYYTADNGDPGTLVTSNWSAVWAESFDADTATPTWNVTTIESLIHTGAICIGADCLGANRFAGDFISAIIDPAGAGHMTWMRRANGTGAVSIGYARIQSAPTSTYIAPPCGITIPPVQLSTVVSRKTHGAQVHNLPLPVTGPHGIECRSGGANGHHTVVFKFADTLTAVDGASVTSGSGQVQSATIGADAHEYLVDLINVTNGQYIFVTLHGVHDSAGGFSNAVSAPMGVLQGDTNADRSVNSADISQTKAQSGQTLSGSNYREDVNVDSQIDSADISAVKAASGTASLP
ncbi:MAG: hypothetical protein ABJB69_06185 [Spartobacteria bacterium]